MISGDGLTTNQLLEAIKRRAFLPNAQNTLKDEDLIRFINEELYDSIVPMIMQVKEEYFTYSTDLLLQPNQSNYAIPYRAIGQKVRDIKYKDTEGNLYTCTRIEVEDRHYFQGASQNRYKCFFLQGNDIVLWPGVGSTPNGYLSLVYYLRPNSIVKESQVGVITAINTSTGVITLSAIPENFTISNGIDFVQARSGHRTIKFDVPVLGVDTVNKTITVAPTDIPSTLIVNDHLAVAGQTKVLQIPSELNSILVERVVARCMASLGDQEGLAASVAKVSEMENKANSMIDDRSEGNPKKINNLNSIIRASKITRRRFFY